MAGLAPRRRAQPLPPVVADRSTAVAGGTTAVALVALVVSDLASRSAPGDRVRDEGTGALVAAAIATGVAAGLASLLHAPYRPLPRSRPRFAAGLALAWAGIGVNRLGRRALADRYRPVVTVLDGHEVVDRGPYRVVRHPMYLGSTLMCTGVGLALGTAPAMLAWALPPLALLRRIAVEERVLAEALGDRYDAYARGRARLVPGVW